MEIRTYDLRHKVEELKDLPENTLMVIAELCMDYYKLGQYSVQEDVDSYKQDEIDELKNKIEELEDELEDADKEYDKLDEAFNNLKDKYNELKNEKR